MALDIPDPAFVRICLQLRLLTEEQLRLAQEEQRGDPSRALAEIVRAQGLFDAAREEKFRQFVESLSDPLADGLWRSTNETIFDFQSLPLLAQRDRSRDVSAVQSIVPVSFDSYPARCGIWIDDEYLGMTPMEAPIEWRRDQGQKKVKIWRGGYRVAKWTLTRGERSVSVKLEELVDERPVRLRLQPAQARIEVDGQSVAAVDGEIVLKWSVTKRRHTLTFSCAGYETKTLEVAREALLRPLDVRLQPVPPALPPDAR